jgi:hypothetical protein
MKQSNRKELDNKGRLKENFPEKKKRNQGRCARWWMRQRLKIEQHPLWVLFLL